MEIELLHTKSVELEYTEEKLVVTAEGQWVESKDWRVGVECVSVWECSLPHGGGRWVSFRNKEADLWTVAGWDPQDSCWTRCHAAGTL